MVRGTGPLGFEQAWLTGASVMAGWISTSLATTVRGAVRGPTLHIALHGGAEYRFGRRRHAPRPGTTMLVPPGREYTVDHLPRTTFALAIDHTRLASEVGALDEFLAALGNDGAATADPPKTEAREQVAAAFWRYYRDDGIHSCYPPGSREEAQVFDRPPWSSR